MYSSVHVTELIIVMGLAIIRNRKKTLYTQYTSVIDKKKTKRIENTSLQIYTCVFLNNDYVI